MRIAWSDHSLSSGKSIVFIYGAPAVEALECGPRIVRNSRVEVNPGYGTRTAIEVISLLRNCGVIRNERLRAAEREKPRRGNTRNAQLRAGPTVIATIRRRSSFKPTARAYGVKAGAGLIHIHRRVCCYWRDICSLCKVCIIYDNKRRRGRTDITRTNRKT